MRRTRNRNDENMLPWGLGIQVGRGAAEPRMMFLIISSSVLFDLSCAIKNNLNGIK